ncbi:hypothetical protein B3286c1_2111 [Brucella vulpis]|nr:hypothetical protein BF3285c1_2112 [Brucella vulpis]CUW50906.1 hypothetical protein B3286c1_2111 [Brucella vulpis]
MNIGTLCKRRNVLAAKRQKDIFAGGNGARGFRFVCNVDPVVAGLLLPKRALQPDERDFRCFRGNDGILRNARSIGMCRVNHKVDLFGPDIGGKAIRSAKAAAANRAAQFCRSSGAPRRVLSAVCLASSAIGPAMSMPID